MGDVAMQEQAPLEKEKLAQQQPLFKNKNVEYTDSNIPTLESKFEELIAALPPLPKHPRRSPTKAKQGVKRQRSPVAKPPPNNRPKKQQEDAELCNDLVGHRIGVWISASSSPTNDNNNNNNNSDAEKIKKGQWCFGRVEGLEEVPSHRHIVKFDPQCPVSSAYVDLTTEIWVALADDDGDGAGGAVGDGANPNTPFLAAGIHAAADKRKGKERVINNAPLENKRRPRPLHHTQPKHHSPLVPPLFETDYFTVYNTICGKLGYEIYALCPNTWSMDEFKVQAFDRGKITLKVKRQQQHQGESQETSSDGDENGGEGGREVENEKYTVELPTRIDPKSARALFTTSGQLYIRVDRSIEKTAAKRGGEASPRL
jgi:hypothetical protein